MKRLFFLAAAALLVVSCGQSNKNGSETQSESAEVPAEEVIQEPTVPMVYSNAYDGFANIRLEPNNNSEIVGELRNGPIGAEFIGVEGQWTKVKCSEGETGYIRSSLLQNTPTKPVNIDPGFIAGAWRIEGAMWGGHCDYIVFTDGTYGYYNDSFCEGGISHAGKWHLEESRIVFTQVYSFVNGEVERTISRYNIDVEKHQIESEGTIYKRAYYTPAQLEAYRKWVKPYVNL